MQFHRQPSCRLPPSPRLKGLKCRTDRGFMHPTASNRALFRRPSFATSSPGARSARIRWSGPRACRAGSGPETFPAWSPADRPRPPCRTPAARRRWQAAVMPAEATPAVRCRSMSASGSSSGAAWCSSSASCWSFRRPGSRPGSIAGSSPGFHVPGRPNLAFTGQALDIWYVFIAIGILTYVGLGRPLLPAISLDSDSGRAVLDGRSLVRLLT